MKILRCIMLTMLSISSVFYATPHTKSTGKPATINHLLNIFKADNVTDLQSFVEKNPKFNWNEQYEHLPWSGETATPLIAATYLGAVNCLTYLLNHNIGSIRNSWGAKSSHGFTASQYAQNPPNLTTAQMPFKNDIANKYTKIANLINKFK
ncbi:hypothetical protein KBD08_00620 [Candidatus Babeliales bacterium]|nr:hypothetical protein [Candidatus Babeliales bacterium]